MANGNRRAEEWAADPSSAPLFSLEQFVAAQFVAAQFVAALCTMEVSEARAAPAFNTSNTETATTSAASAPLPRRTIVVEVPDDDDNEAEADDDDVPDLEEAPMPVPRPVDNGCGVDVTPTPVVYGIGVGVHGGEMPMSPRSLASISAAIMAALPVVVPFNPDRSRYYTVTRGKAVGVFTDWTAVSPLVIGVPCSVFSRYATFRNALAAFEDAAASGTVAIIS
ncbi:uncharacterized protein B0H18DRAFT_1123742 [Fomitopsis serialis]|uniref:uncharacterized protein n=1 Tax=Fomitopsis serialis TaxID=139415 RepID=UPI0020074172|nr:uncharacterized protein B0H18DRAFT_1123742 [Neoantrodia serialis]KAH9917219.1 hypothetical protein B0H18DRAFT_1123742 [Neoantrodia serialis]